MPVQKSQLRRLLHITAMLKENRYPTAESLREDFARIDSEQNIPIACGLKTVRRDLQLLRKEYGCPLAFDRVKNGWYLKHHAWDFIAPAVLDEHEMLAAVVGARVAEKIFPSPLKNKIRDAVDFLLNNHNPDFLDTANMNSLTILSGLYMEPDPDIFMSVFTSWQNHAPLRIVYEDYSGEITRRVFEPHTLVFYRNSWYSKGFCRMKNAPRTFAVHRMREAETLPGSFEPDIRIIRSVNMDEFLGFQREGPVTLKVGRTARNTLRADPLHSRQRFSRDRVTIPSVSREVLFPFLLSQMEDAELLAPGSLRKEFLDLLRRMTERYLPKKG